MAAQTADGGPFAVNAPESIPLSNAPLERVLCQIRWPELTGFAQQYESIGDSLGLSLANSYPLFNRIQESNFILGPNGVTSQPGSFAFQWSSANGEWKVHFAPTFVSLETSRYTNKEDLLSRLEQILTSINLYANIPHYTRVGYRYTNRVTADTNDLIKPEVRGGGAVPLRNGAEVMQSVTETMYRVDEDRFLARWAQLPAGTTIDPAITPLDKESWILDLDSFSEVIGPFIPADIARKALALAKRGYTFFRWSVTTEFLTEFGAHK